MYVGYIKEKEQEIDLVAYCCCNDGELYFLIKQMSLRRKEDMGNIAFPQKCAWLVRGHVSKIILLN